MKDIYKRLSILLLFIVIVELAILFSIGKESFQRNLINFVNQVQNKKPSLEKVEKYYIADSEGNPIDKNRYSHLSRLNNNLFIASKANNKTCIIDSNGKTIIPCKYLNINYNNNFYIVSEMKNYFKHDYRSVKYGLLDKNGKKIFPTKYDKIYINKEYIFLSKNGICKVYNNNNLKYLFKIKNISLIEQIGDKLFEIKKDNKYYIINDKGKKVLKTPYLKRIILSYKSPDDYLFKIEKNNKYGIVNIKGEYILPCEYEKITRNSKENNTFWVMKNNKWGLVDNKNNLIVNYSFDIIPAQLSENTYMSQIEVIDNRSSKKPKINHPIIRIDATPKKNAEPKHQVIGDLHVVSVYQGHYDKEREFAEHSTGKVRVRVEKTNTPITLLLTSSESVIWDIKTIPGVNIKKIYFGGYYDGDVIVKSKKIPIEKLNSREYFKDSNSRKIKDYFEKEPTSFQYKDQSDYFLVDGNNGTRYKEFPKHESTKEAVRFVSEFFFRSNVSSDGLEVFDVSHTVFSTNKYFNKGKYYFELTLKSSKPQSKKHINAGIISEYEYIYECTLWDVTDECYAYDILSSIDADFRNNDILGIAVDFDDGNLYLSRNGKWILGNPETKAGAYKFENDGREYTAAVSTWESWFWKANFGSKKFKYKIPKGYRPYDEYSAKKNNVNI